MKSNLQIDPDNKVISKQFLILNEINPQKCFKHKYVLDCVGRKIKVFFFKQFFFTNVKNIIERNF